MSQPSSSGAAHTPQEFLGVVMRYVEACRARDSRLLLAFAVAAMAVLEAVAAGYLFRGANVFASLGELGTFSRIWLAICTLGAVGLVFYILTESRRFHSSVVPRCPRCDVTVRNLDDFLMAMSFPAAVRAQPTVRCDVCDYGIAGFSAGAFRVQ